jgi:hypothetical protein
MYNRILIALLAVASAAPLSAQQKFDSAEAASQALISAAQKHDNASLALIFGPQGTSILSCGKPDQDRAEQAEFAQLAGTKMRLLPDPRNTNRVLISIGTEDWPFPVPLVRRDGKWSFDASETPVEMQARRIGTHELDAIEICTGFVAAQRKYASQIQAKDGLMHYASHILSGPGRSDGLYTDGSAALVPRDFADAAWDEHKGNAKPYHGYYFKILDGQGPNAMGGAHTYRAKDKLLGGFGLVAWPAQYGVTGIETFIVNQDGIVYEKDIAPPAVGKPVVITVYDPDPSWKPVE